MQSQKEILEGHGKATTGRRFVKMDFLESLKQFDDFLSAKGVNSETIHAAEAALSLRFSSEYKSYLSECGFVSAVENC